MPVVSQFVSNTTSITCDLKLVLINVNPTVLPSSVKTTYFVLLVVNGITAPVTFLLSLSVIWVVLEMESLRSNGSKLLQAALALTDLTVSVVRQPLGIVYFACLLKGYPLPCTFFHLMGFFSMTTGLLSLSSLMMVSAERYLAIEHPFIHRTRLKTKNLVLSITVVWLFILIKAVLFGFLIDSVGLNINAKLASQLIIAIKCLFVIFYCTIKVHFTAERHLKAILSQAAPILQNVVGERRDQEAERQDHRRQFREYKRTIAICMLVLANFVFYCPFIIVLVLDSTPGDKTDYFEYTAILIAITFVNLQSLVNRFMCLRLSDIRKSVGRKFCRCSIVYPSDN